MDLSVGWTLALGLLGGVLAGTGAGIFWQRRRQLPKALVPPSTWPLAARNLMSAEEHKALRWLREIFHDHVVVLKVSVLRFTVPKNHKSKSKSKSESRGGNEGDGEDEAEVDSLHWQTLLSGVYCTLTVCTAQGHVVGCVDVPGKRGLSQPKRTMKEKLLSDCGIAYTVVTIANLPTSAAMRTAFLGEIAPELSQIEPTRGGDSNFQADLASFNRRARRSAQRAALARLNSQQTA